MLATIKAAARISGLETKEFHVGKHPFVQFYTHEIKVSHPMTAYEAEAWLNGFVAANARLLQAVMQ